MYFLACILPGRVVVTRLPRLNCHSFLCHTGSSQWAACSWRCQQQKWGCSHRNLTLRTLCRPTFDDQNSKSHIRCLHAVAPSSSTWWEQEYRKRGMHLWCSLGNDSKCFILSVPPDFRERRRCSKLLGWGCSWLWTWGRERKECVLKAAKSCKITRHSHQLLIKFPFLSLSPNDWCLISLHSVSLGAEHTVVHCFVCIELASRS